MSPQRPSGPPRLCAAGPGDALLQPHVLPGLELPVSHGNLESFTRWSQMERLPVVSCLRDRTDFRFAQTLVHGTRLEKTEATAVVHELL